MATAINLGFSRIGPNRELKKAVESYWSGKTSQDDLIHSAKRIRETNWRIQSDAGITQLPAGDFSFYDHVLDAAFAFDLVPDRFRALQLNDVDLYFAMARGVAGGRATQALEMTKWFDTNYHYLVPELTGEEEFSLKRNSLLDAYREGIGLGLNVRPVILGPISLLYLSKFKQVAKSPLCLLERAVAGYGTLLKQLGAAGANWIQLDEPVLVLDLDEAFRNAVSDCYERLAKEVPAVKILLATYFGPLRENLALAQGLPISALHLDLVRGSEQIEHAIGNCPDHLTLSLGLVDGRNIWKTDLTQALEIAERAARAIPPERLLIAPSCSLLHVPVDVSTETLLKPEIRNWLAFGKQKLEEVSLLARALNQGRAAVRAELEQNAKAIEARCTSGLVFHERVRQRLAELTSADFRRTNSHAVRSQRQQETLELPMLPTTTIGSFPQTDQLRRERLRRKKGELSAVEYDQFIRHEIEEAIRRQEEIGLDVLVHGEAERNDMVEYFGELLEGFAFTQNGWVQSYGSRCVKPPIIYGDVVRRAPMTVSWWQFAQSLTERPVKGMLTGPVTILQWSFVRDDQPRRDTCFQLALAIRDETIDLENAGCRVIQIDEPALREGLPLRQADVAEYLKWAVECFRLASSGVKDTTQIHTHMCYANFNDIVEAIAAMDADVISLESARSQMELLEAFAESRYPNDVGPGVYEVHSPRIPEKGEMISLLNKALQVIRPERLWVNPDCGLKTRRWEEVIPSLTNMVDAALSMRDILKTNRCVQ
jgi:5-methyltetrahydropteroyltriglutamate--homocysteine methyltransferase